MFLNMNQISHNESNGTCLVCIFFSLSLSRTNTLSLSDSLIFFFQSLNKNTKLVFKTVPSHIQDLMKRRDVKYILDMDKKC